MQSNLHGGNPKWIYQRLLWLTTLHDECYCFLCLKDKQKHHRVAGEQHKEDLKDLEGKDDHYHQEGDLNQQHKELGDDLGQDDLGDIDPCNPRPVNQTLLPLDHQGYRSEADGDPKGHTEIIITCKESNTKVSVTIPT